MPNKKVELRVDEHVLRAGDPQWKRFPCLVWTGYLSRLGYAGTSFRGKPCLAHRAAYIVSKGEIAAGLDLDHLCRNRACVQPEHLEPITHAENVRRGMAAALKLAKTHCRHGHEYTEKNTLIGNKKGDRICRECKAIKARAYRKRLREKTL